MSGKKSKSLRSLLHKEIGFDVKSKNPISNRIYKRLKRRYSNLNHIQKSKFKIQDYV
jgi:hypothetical protein